MKPRVLVLPADQLRPHDSPFGDVVRPGQLEPRLLSILNAARYLDIPPATLRNWLCTGAVKLETVKLNGRRLVVKSSLDAYLDQLIEDGAGEDES